MSRTIFTNVFIFDGSGAQSFPGEVLVEGARIAGVAKKGEPIDRDGAEIVDGRGATLMPGLVEAHAHLTFPWSVDRPAKSFVLAPEEHQFFTAHNAKVLLDYGFTSAFSAGALKPGIEVAVRDEINAGWIPGPRLLAASMERAAQGVPGELIKHEHKTVGPQELRTWVKEMADLGVNTIKLVLSGRGALQPEFWNAINYSEEELAGAAEQCRESGLWMAAHAQAAESVKQAVRHGFRAIYHCSFADEEALDMLEAKKSEIFLAPAIGVFYAAAYEAGRTPEEVRAEGSEVTVEETCKVYQEIRKRGIPVLPGGDYGFPYNPQGKNARDLEHFVKLFGYTPAEVLHAATHLGGKLMGLGDELGLVKKGYLADLLMLDGDPLNNISLFQDRNNLLMIVKDGEFHKRPQPRRSQHEPAV